MMSLSAFSTEVVDRTLDWGIDIGRRRLGLSPRPPEIVRFGFADRPRVQARAAIYVKFRRAVVGQLECNQGDRTLYQGVAPRDGHVAVTPLTLEPIRLRLELESRHGLDSRHGRVVADTIIQPMATGPGIERIDAPPKVRLGNAFIFGWRAPEADRVWISDSENGDERPSPVIGEIQVRPERPGSYTVRIAAENRWGRTIETRRVDVIAPALRVTLLNGARRTGHPGKEVRFDWRIEGARDAWLVLPGQDASQRVGFDHALIVVIGSEPEEFQLIARGHSNDEQSVVLRTAPQFHFDLADFTKHEVQR